MSLNCSSSGGHGVMHNSTNGTCVLPGKPNGVVMVVLKQGEIDRNIKFLNALDKRFNNKYHYPVAIFGYNLDVSIRQELRAATNSSLEFYELDSIGAEDVPEWINRKDVREFADCGYNDDSVADRARYRYLANEAQAILAKKYDWIWRMGSNSELLEDVKFDPFLKLASEGKKFGYITAIKDDQRCVKGLWNAVRDFVQIENIQPTFLDLLPEQSVFFNGFHIYHTSLWISDEYHKLFDYLDHKGGFFYSRWTDANVQTLALSLFTPSEQVHRFIDIGFRDAPIIEIRTTSTSLRKPLEKVWEQNVQIMSIHAKRSESLQPLFSARRFGYIGGDVATSIALPGGKYLWLFGDTYVGMTDGERRNGDSALLIHNSLAIVPDAEAHKLAASDVSFFWRQGEDGVPKEVFTTDDPHIVLWPISGVAANHNGKKKLLLLAQRVRTRDGR